MKKILSLLLSLALVFTIAVPASTIHASAASNITYEIDGSTLYINGTGPMEDYKDTDDVPWRYERGLAKGIKKIVIAEGITHIGNRSLGNFSAVETVVLPSTLTSVGEAAFRLSTALKTVDIPAGVTSIGERAFEECISLTSVTTNGLQGVIPKNAFSGCSSLTSVTLNEGITTIEKYAFINSPSLKVITLPASVTLVEPDAFPETTAITCKNPDISKYGKNAYRYLQTVEYNVYQNYDYAYEVLSLVNKERAAVGLAPLKWDPELMDAAMERAGELVLLFSHTRPNSGGCGTINPYLRGENAAEGAVSPEDVVDSWMNSPGHRQNILMKSYKTLGVGCIEFNDHLYWIQCFGTEHSGKTQTLPANQTITQSTDFAIDTFEYDFYHTMTPIAFKPEIRLSKTTMTKGTSQTAAVHIAQDEDDYHAPKVKNRGITWSSSDPSVATVSSSGKIKALKAGKTTIKAKMKHYTLKKTIIVACSDKHTYKQVSVTPATYEKNGKIKYKCSICEKTKTSTIYKIKATKLSATTLTYNGKVRKPTVKVTNSQGKVIDSKYYTVTYQAGRKKVGTYKVTVKFQGRYKGTATQTFKIVPKKQ